MRIKKYFAKNMRDALTQIKEDLGEDAVILKTRKIQKNLFSIGEKNEVEVTAAVDDDTSEHPNDIQLKPLNLTPKKDEVSVGIYGRPRSSCIVDMDRPDAPVVKKWVPPEQKSTQHDKRILDTLSNGTKMEELKDNLEELKELVKSVIDNKADTGPIQKVGNSKLFNQLIDSEVKSDLAHSIVKKINGNAECGDKKLIIKKLTDIFSDEFPVSGPLRLKKDGPLVVAFVGPTGSGKTTTIAKLAAHCAINKNKRVSIIAADTYRIAAIEQIKIFADIVKVHLEVVFSPDEVSDALNSCKNSDIILVDTAGRSQKNDQHLQELKDLMCELHPDEIHLVLGATTKYSDLKNTIEKFSIVKVNRLLFTKIDETLRLGNVFSVANDFRIPVSYLTFGQSVPDDIEPAQCSRIVENLMEGIVL
jgi:flagellar biosynthesis protein FlhF